MRYTQTSGLHLAFNFPLAKLYTNSLLSTLNARPAHGSSTAMNSSSHGAMTGGIAAVNTRVAMRKVKLSSSVFCTCIDVVLQDEDEINFGSHHYGHGVSEIVFPDALDSCAMSAVKGPRDSRAERCWACDKGLHQCGGNSRECLNALAICCV